MADEHDQPEQEWDEYAWERFLRNQELRAERYMELLEKYVDHPERDALIAREMGWFDAASAGDPLFSQLEFPGCGEGEEAEDLTESVVDAQEEEEPHPLYQAAFDLCFWLESSFSARGERAASHPAAMELGRQAYVMSSRLSSALEGAEGMEVGMVIAYLKRALRGATLALNAYAEVHREQLLGRVRDRRLREKLFYIRDSVVSLIGEKRAEWRRRSGN